jgi:hypothetical protein
MTQFFSLDYSREFIRPNEFGSSLFWLYRYAHSLMILNVFYLLNGGDESQTDFTLFIVYGAESIFFLAHLVCHCSLALLSWAFVRVNMQSSRILLANGRSR